ncbi:hypothetical protein POM88_031907 [Heracleum sosnowskyi]|uniref:Uncharacterized protein n=1 Tax=Heracleum sosnowskyi TaxID=360622 RepID=A0AAD8HYB1_9APIA|nr:hypothetical protein POM88_031903 [Heracleum sosnowskyi]KAK1375712.1 hypothetical protein POM88_031905 [Heracleum sosnowskyi]KAK1375714.1 hypothetical protein POM88_031907 [Heracleum sosnowskyi]
MLMFGIEGIVVGMVGKDAGKGGSTSLGTVVGIVGSVGRVGRGVFGNGGIETLGNDGIVGSVGAEVCSKWRAPKLTSRTESDKAATKDRMKQCLAVAIFNKSKSSVGDFGNLRWKHRVIICYGYHHHHPRQIET